MKKRAFRLVQSRKFTHGAKKYENGVARLLRRGTRVLLMYVALIAVAVFVMMRLPTSFFADRDQGLYDGEHSIATRCDAGAHAQNHSDHGAVRYGNNPRWKMWWRLRALASRARAKYGLELYHPQRLVRAAKPQAQMQLRSPDGSPAR